MNSLRSWTRQSNPDTRAGIGIFFAFILGDFDQIKI